MGETALARVARKSLQDLTLDLGLSEEQIAQVKRDILEERVKTADGLATLLSIPVAEAKLILASDEIQTQVMACFRESTLTELDLIELPMLMHIVRSAEKPTPRMRASKRIRQILDKKPTGPKVQVNVQQNNNNGEKPTGWVDNQVIEMDDK